ncbi:MAG TPA: hypothetical protein VGT08_00840, partial [Terracidiphilus sp.]|nr:hypothetical protein [Terracidiphilus sp.]
AERAEPVKLPGLLICAHGHRDYLAKGESGFRTRILSWVPRKSILRRLPAECKRLSFLSVTGSEKSSEIITSLQKT